MDLMTQPPWRSDLFNRCARSSAQLSDLKSRETPDDSDGLSFLRIALIYSHTRGMALPAFDFLTRPKRDKEKSPSEQVGFSLSRAGGVLSRTLPV